MSELRNLQPSDWSQFELLENAIFPDDPFSFEHFNYRIQNEGFKGLFDHDKLVGYVFCMNYANYNHLHRIGVHPDYQGKGLGSKLMNYAISFFARFMVNEIWLYVETKNTTAIKMYEKFGFTRKRESWHYIIDIEKFNSQSKPKLEKDKFTIREVTESDLEQLKEKFSNLNYEEIYFQFQEKKLNKNDNLFLGLFSNEIVGFARFNQNYSGCRPFIYQTLEMADYFVDGIINNYVLPAKKVVRLTFDDYVELANYLSERGYIQHHHMYKMVLK